MEWRALALALVPLAAAAPTVPPVPAAGPVRVEVRIEAVRQLGPIYPLHPAAVEVQLRNVGKTDCATCEVRLIGGQVTGRASVPRLRAGETAKVAIDGLRFPVPGKIVLVVSVDAPPNQVSLGTRKPSATLEITVLPGAPVQRGTPR